MTCAIGEIDKLRWLSYFHTVPKLEENIKVIKRERCDNQGNEMWYPLILEYLIHSPYGEKYGYGVFEDMITHFRHRQQLELRIIKEIIGGRAIVLCAKNWKIEEIIPLMK